MTPQLSLQKTRNPSLTWFDYRINVFSGSFSPNNSIDSSPINIKKYKPLLNKLTEFEKLDSNWDTYNADKITRESIEKTEVIINYLKLHNNDLLNTINIHIFPMRDGGIQFEFDSNTICAELEVSHMGGLIFLAFDNNGEMILKEQLFELSELLTRLNNEQYA